MVSCGFAGSPGVPCSVSLKRNLPFFNPSTLTPSTLSTAVPYSTDVLSQLQYVQLHQYCTVLPSSGATQYTQVATVLCGEGVGADQEQIKKTKSV